MKILYLEREGTRWSYYNDMVTFLGKHCHLKLASDSFDHAIDSFAPDAVLVGFSHTSGAKRHRQIILNTDLPVFVILNKEYDDLEDKLNWIKLLAPNRFFTVHHDFEQFGKITNIPCDRIMWSANQAIFKRYDLDYKYDLFFSGVVRPEQTGDMRSRVLSKLDSLNNFRLMIKASYFANDKMTPYHSFDMLDYSFDIRDYAKTINHSKIALTTTGPADLVGTRYFEIMASRKALLFCNEMPSNVYGDMLIDGYNCVMFANENDFIEKFHYFVEHEHERALIVENAYQKFMKELTWDHQVLSLLGKLKVG